MNFTPGENIGPYRITEQLGQGGMATVFKAYHAMLDRYVAIKALHPAFKSDPNFLGRFEREARIIAKLDHPNIIPIYDFAQHDGVPYLVIRYVEGETLKAVLRNGHLAPAHVLGILRPIADALAYAHSQGIFHRDIKPSNIILANDGHVYLADFGLARIAQSAETTLSHDALIGTPQYISPEQAKSQTVDARSDIYSLGIVMFEMLTGRVPFSSDTPYAVIHDQIYTRLPLPTTINPDLSPAIERVLLKTLAKEPEARYANANALRAAFERAVGGSRVLPAPPLRIHRPRRWPLRLRPTMLAVSATLILILVIGLVIPNLTRSINYVSSLAQSSPGASQIVTRLPTATEAPLPAPTSPNLATPTLAALPVNLPPPSTRTLKPSPSPTVGVPGMVLVPAGVFWMGQSDADSNAAADEKPGHYVELSAFYIDRFEVGNGDYARCVKAGICFQPAGAYAPQSPQMAFGNPAFDNHPVVFVSQTSAWQFCNWAGKRLPTEAEWEKAARGHSDQRVYTWGNLWDGYRANAAQKIPGPLAVNVYTPEGCSPYGACNMVGNVAEWVADYYDSNFYAETIKRVPLLSVARDPINADAATGRLSIRGGSFKSTIFDARVSKRSARRATETVDDLGFRCAQSVK
ncbi:MAG: SUMF1/EgtB/PvdO family nonheme iron enzyme [Chloroflexi bacterium]|nr:SUMF1/EgtB/PvdO family nonheme iron enzyme [Chloroflexota bacterium]